MENTHRDEKRERERERKRDSGRRSGRGRGGRVGSALRDDLAGARGKSRPGMHGERERRLATRSRGVANSVARKLARKRERDRERGTCHANINKVSAVPACASARRVNSHCAR